MRNRHQYPPEWYDTIRPQILLRDKYVCKHCKIRHRQWVATKQGFSRVKIEVGEKIDFLKSGYKVYMIRLHVSHLDNNKSNIADNNLISLCVTCHAKQDGKYKALIRKGNPHPSQISIFDEIKRVLEMGTTLPQVLSTLNS